MDENKVNHVGLKVAGLVVGIIAGIALISVIFSLTALPGIKYRNAEKNAAEGKYDVAARILYNMDYKDSKRKLGEYALIAGEEYLKKGDTDNASIYLTYAANSENEEAAEKAKSYFKSSEE